VEATQVAMQAGTAAEEMGDDRQSARSKVTMTAVRMVAEEHEPGDLETMGETLKAAVQQLNTAGDVAAEATAWRWVALVESLSGHDDEAVRVLRRVIDLAESAGDQRLANRAAAGLANTISSGEATASEVSAQCHELLERVKGDRYAEAIILSTTAVAEAMQGNFDTARELYARSAANVADLGQSRFSASQSIESSQVEMLAGDPERAAELLRSDDAELARMGERYFRSSVTGLLAQALEATGNVDEATKFVELARDLADADDAESQIVWRSALAKIVSRSGEAERARELVNEALELANTTEMLSLRADTAADAAIVYRRIGAAAEAADQLDAARRLFTEKGNVAAIQAIERRMATEARVS
jgi:tetratricopeptide (TPR) repeat protein